MTTRQEAILEALLAALSPHPAQVIREEVLPQRCPEAGLVNLVPGDPVEQGVHLGTGTREWMAQHSLECVVQAPDAAQRNAALDALLAALPDLLADPTLGGLADFLLIGAPESADHVPIEGAATAKGCVVPITVFFETSQNPMEAI